ncbi:MAG: diguanylate cyclase [Rhizobacter sp.]|nr:diguanylate cyclase [Rhizobacter sp.]MBP6269165.1 diguanylate cyclase [Rhizobacter sp.]
MPINLVVRRALQTADALIDSRLPKPYRIGALRLEVSASIGLAACADSDLSAHAIRKATDAAMYQAKQAGKCRHVTSDFELLEARLRHRLESRCESRRCLGPAAEVDVGHHCRQPAAGGGLATVVTLSCRLGRRQERIGEAQPIVQPL